MRAAFEHLYGRPPRWIGRAPGRVNLIGEYTDFNGGFVLPMAIERWIEVAAAPNGSNIVTLRSTAFEDIVRIDLAQPIEPDPRGRWSNYPKGVLAGFIHGGYSVCGFDALIDSTVPAGGGLSSSAALEVATATLLEAMVDERLDPARKAALCREAEHVYAQVPCGIMDQLVCTMGREDHLLLLDCRSQEPQWIEFADTDVSVLIVATHVKHALAGGEYAVRRDQCEAAAAILGVPLLCEATREELEGSRHRMDETIFRRARHVIHENARTTQAAQAVQERRWSEVGELMYSSHESLRRDFEVSCRELDVVVEIARDIGLRGGVYGCRMTGGGFGGCAIALIETQAQAAIVSAMTTEYQSRIGATPDIFASRPAQGARLICLDCPVAG